MARPKKYKNQEDEVFARYFSQSLIREISHQSGFSSNKIAKAFEGKFNISGEMWRQYANGYRIMNMTNQSLLLQFAVDCSWVSQGFLGKRFKSVQAQSIPREEKARLEITYRAWRDQLQANSINNLRSAIQDLVEIGWSDAELVTAAILLSEDFIPMEQRTLGGLVSASSLQKQLSTSMPQPATAWVRWSMEIFPPEETRNPADQC